MRKKIVSREIEICRAYGESQISMTFPDRMDSQQAANHGKAQKIQTKMGPRHV